MALILKRPWSLLAARCALAGFAVVLCALAGCTANRVTADPSYFPAPPGTAHAVHLKSFNSLTDLVSRRGSWVEIFRGRPASPFVKTPAGIAYRSGHLYICDTGFNVVHDWDLATGKARHVKPPGEVSFDHPVDVASDEVGTLYIADSGRGEILAIDSRHDSILFMRPPGGESFKPVAVAVHDGKLYSTNIETHRVDVFSTENGSHIGSFGRLGSDSGNFYYPMGITVDTGGRIYVADMMNSRVQMFSPQHAFELSMGGPGNRYGDMGKPKHLDVGPDNTIFVADSEFAHIHLFSRDGSLLMFLGGPDSKPGGTPLPLGVAVAPSLPDNLVTLVPPDFDPHYYLFVTNTVGPRRINLFAMGLSR